MNIDRPKQRGRTEGGGEKRLTTKFRPARAPTTTRAAGQPTLPERRWVSSPVELLGRVVGGEEGRLRRAWRGVEGRHGGA
uniref:Uncharacterized protein n=1 Tax=Triticum urartu TaxID=4572 RepID=A0A8R7R175_TRIUA